MAVAKVTHQQEADSQFRCPVFTGPAPPCYQHCSWEPVRRPAGSVRSRVVDWGDYVITTISSDINPLAIADMQYQSSVMVTAPLSNLILHPSTESIVPIDPSGSIK